MIEPLDPSDGRYSTLIYKINEIIEAINELDAPSGLKETVVALQKDAAIRANINE